MIILDIETSGISKLNCGIWQIGAVEFENPSNYFFEECRVDDEDITIKAALEIAGKTEEELRDKSKKSQKELLEEFFSWVRKIKNRTLVCQNPAFDFGFIEVKANKYGLFDPNIYGQNPFPYRLLDTHSLAQAVYSRVHGKMAFDEERGASKLNLEKILEFCGIPDERIRMSNQRIVKGGKPHNALEDARLTAEVLSRLIYGKNLLEEFSSLKIPEYLKR